MAPGRRCSSLRFTWMLQAKKVLSSSQDGGVSRNPLLLQTTKRRITTNLKSINNQKHQKNQTSWNSDNQGIKEKINQNNQTGKAADSSGWLRKTSTTLWTMGGRAGCLPPRAGCTGGPDLGENWDSELTVGYAWGCWGRRNSQSHARVHSKVH